MPDNHKPASQVASKENSHAFLPGFLKTAGGETKSNAIQVPGISLPNGGGAIKGIDEKFSVNAVNGTASFSVSLPFSAARGAVPSLSLTYNSGSGNGVFGLGWSLGLSSVKRKTNNTLPRYTDTAEPDTFLFADAEDLVPAFKRGADGSFPLDSSGDYIIDQKDSADGLFFIRFYMPRTEGLFARIEQWSNKNSGEIKWRVITKDNNTTLFGWSAASRISDPKDINRVFEWLPEFVFDNRGNCAHYIYKKEDEKGINPSLLQNKNRIAAGNIKYSNLYIEKILYGNKTPYKKMGDPFPPEADYLFSNIFDYGEYDPLPPYNKIKDWDFRPDAFSDYKAGFEIRTTRLCKRVLLFHHFKEANEYEGLVKSLDFEYNTTQPAFTFLAAITARGYIKKTDGTYSNKNLPAVEFGYQQPDWNTKIKTIAAADAIHVPAGLDEQRYQFTDLFNEGLSGILTEQANGWYYKHNLGDGKFEQAELVTPKPSFFGLGNKLQLTDLDADGGKQLVNFSTTPRGYFELDDDNEWQGFRNFQTLPNVNFTDANTRMLDLNGDGKPEILISEDTVFTWYPSDGRKGFSPARKSQKPFDEEAGTSVVFADEKQTVFLADMSGDGLTDLVRICNGEVCYWPNLGYGKFGEKVAMDNAPRFDYPDAFNPDWLRMADIDGSGVPDIIYLGNNKFRCWMNLGGNSFSAAPFEIDSFPEIHNNVKIAVTDLLGNGVACIVWSGSLSKDVGAPIKYIDLMNSRKPHVMVSYKNNMGKEVSLEYLASTKFYIEDKLNGHPWVTKLHFPVHCVAKTEIHDRISGSRFVSSYKYHHGYYDHPEKEFRGFGMVEQADAEHFEDWVKGNASNITDNELHQEPVISKNWFHTGAFISREKILSQFAQEYWYEEMKKQGFPVTLHEVILPDAKLIAAPNTDPALINNLDATEWRQAVRACKSMGLRSEVFAKDAAKNGNTEEARKKELTPYSVSTHNCIIELLQPRGKNKYAVFVVKESEAITYNYERNTEDPRIAHNLNIRLDEYGNVLESAIIVYPRITVDNTLPVETKQEQQRTIIVYTRNKFTNDVVNDLAYHLRMPSETATWELKAVAKTTPFYRPEDFNDILSDAKSGTAVYHETDKAIEPGKAQKRLIEHIRSTYYRNNLTGALPLHKLESLAFPFESYQLAYSPELLSDIFSAKVPNQADRILLMEEGKFIHLADENDLVDNNWWIRSGTASFITGAESDADAQKRFYLPVLYSDPFGAKTKLSYYKNYLLFIEKTEDAFGNISAALLFNFRMLSPQKMKDINGNLYEMISDELGMVKATAVFGKGDEADELAGLTEFTDAAETAMISDFFNNTADSVQLTSIGKNLLQHATARFLCDLDVYKNTGKPAVIASVVREEHFKKNNNAPVQISFEYSNGLGKVIMKKTQAEPGVAKKVIVNPDNTYTVTEIDSSALNPKQLRWVGNGKTVLNNKGNAVKQYEPYFSVTPQYEDFKELVETGVTPIMYCDAAGRLIKTEMPDGSFSKTIFDSWKQVLYDANDTVKDSLWWMRRTDNTRTDFIADAKEQQAAVKASKHGNTPNTMHFDTLGRPVLNIDHNRNIKTDANEFYLTKIKLDAEGNLRALTDTRGNTAMQFKYDMLGMPVYKNSMDAGQRWLLANISGNPLRTWDERNHTFQYSYDDLQRPTQSKVTGGDGETPLDNIFDRIIYGESLLSAGRANELSIQAMNVLGKSVKHFDTGGLIDTPVYDFKGKPVATTRRLFRNYKTVANWTDANLNSDLEADLFTVIIDTDALGRVSRQTAPDGSILTPSYNEAGLLNSGRIKHAGSVADTVYIKDIDYNEKGQRNKIIYGNNVATKFYYDAATFRLAHIDSKKSNNEVLQNLFYTYDPSGNITAIEDKAIPIQFFANSIIEPLSEYTYDALYRLVEARGRENNAALKFGDCDNWNDNPFMQSLAQGDAMAVRNYTESYNYDFAGNILQMKHVAIGGSWTRNYEYELNNNRIKNTGIGDNGNPTNYTKYAHHAKHGFLLELPHLETIGWNFKEELLMTSRQHCTEDNIPVITYYQYDGQGHRIRKITENATAGAAATKKEERIYIGGYELYKKHTGANAGLVRTSLSLTDEGHCFVLIETRNDIDDGTEKSLVRYQLHNHIGSAAMELDATARLVSYEEYHPYGTTAYRATNKDIKSSAKRYRYTGMERDEETGLEYHSARYYLPWLGRWMSPDPIGIKNDINVYAYCGGKVIAYTDVNGKYDKPGHDILTRLQATQYMKYEDAVKLGRAANLTDMVTEFGAGATDSAYNKEDLHALKDQSPEITRNEIREKMKNFKFSEDKEIALKQFGAYFLHPFEDTYSHTQENMSIPGMPFFGHFGSPEADMVVGNKSEEAFIKERKEWDAFIKSAKEIDSLKGFFKEDEKTITDEDWKKIYRDLKAAENYESIRSNTARDVGLVILGVASFAGITAGGVAIAMSLGHSTGEGIAAALIVTAFAILGLAVGILGPMAIGRLFFKAPETNKSFVAEAAVLDKALVDKGFKGAETGDNEPSSPKSFKEYCKPVNSIAIEYCTPN